jgi:hypothetical protein
LQVLPVQRLPSLQLPWLLVLVEEVWFSSPRCGLAARHQQILLGKFAHSKLTGPFFCLELLCNVTFGGFPALAARPNGCPGCHGDKKTVMAALACGGNFQEE